MLALTKESKPCGPASERPLHYLCSTRIPRLGISLFGYNGGDRSEFTNHERPVSSDLRPPMGKPMPCFATLGYLDPP